MPLCSRLPAVSLMLCAFVLRCAPLAAQQPQYSTAHRDAERSLPQTVGQPAAAQLTSAFKAKLAANRTGTSLIVADFDSDGTPDLLTGYTTPAGGMLLLQRGSPVALAPTPNEWAMTARGELVAPYVAKAEPIDLPVHPDFLATADIAGFGHADVLVAQKGDTAVYLLESDGKGGFSAPVALPLAGPVTALATWRGPGGSNLIAAAITQKGVGALQFLAADGKQVGMALLPGAVTSFEFTNVNGGSTADALATVAGSALLIDGDSLLSGTPNVQTVSAGGAAAVVAGLFAYNLDGGQQLAVLGQDATLHLYARGPLNLHQLTPDEYRARRRASHDRSRIKNVKTTDVPWTEFETTHNFGAGSSAGSVPHLIHAHLTGSGTDDLVLISGGQYIQLTHQSTPQGDVVKTTPVLTFDTTSQPVTAIATARVAADARLGIVTLGGLQPEIAQLPANRTINVNTTADSATLNTAACTSGAPGCTLRSAIAVANADYASSGTTKADTINLPAGTYTLSACNGSNCTDVNGDVNYHFDLDAGANILGAGVGSTIINANHLDNIFDIESGVVNTSNPSFDTYLSNMTLENGTNSGNPYTNGISVNYEGGIIDGFGNSGTFFTMVNVTTTSGLDRYSSGGCIESGNFGSGSVFTFELDTSTVQNCISYSTGGGLDGGGGYVKNILVGDTFINNSAPKIATSGPTDASGTGGGAQLGGAIAGTADVVTNTIFTGNSATALAGGLFEEGAVTMTGTSITNNTVGAGNTSGFAFGGGLVINPFNTSSTVTTTTVVGNSVTGSGTLDGAGVCFETESGSTPFAFTMHYNRIHGNTGGPHTGLAIGCLNVTTGTYGDGQTINASDNWWGCNGPASGTGCDTEGLTPNATAGTVTLSPFTTLTLGISSGTPPYGSTLVATASLGQDSSGTVYSIANDAAYFATPISTFSITNTGFVTYNPSATAFSSSAAATASGTVNATGNGTATVTVDGTTVTKTYTVTAPDLSVTSAHSGNFKAGDTADTYTLSVANIGTGPTSGTVTVVDALPSGFTATALSGTGWTCTLSSLTCTRSDQLNASVGYPAITLTVSVNSSDVGTYTNTATVSGGGEANTNNDTGTDPTIVVGAPTISETFSPTSVAPNANSAVTFTIGNPSANAVSLTGVAFSDTLPTGLRVSSPSGAATTCTGGTATAAAGGGSIALSGATIAAGATCTVMVNVSSPSIGSYINTTGTVTATNSNAGSTASATLTVNVTPTRLVYTSVPPTPITAGGNAGTVAVALEDAAGNVATGNSSVSVTLAVTGPGGYSQTYTATANNGVATFNLSSVALTVAGSYTYTASATGLTSGVATETINPAAAASFTVTGLSTITAPQMSGAATVTARDAYGNVASGFTGTVTLSSTDPTASFSPATYTYTASDAGAHAFTVTFNTAGAQSVTATSGVIAGSETGILVEDSIVILNSNATLARTTDTGVQTTAFGSASSTVATYGAVAFDNAGDIWSVTNATSAVQEFTAAGAGVTVSGSSAAGVNTPVSLFIDGLGQVWVANGNNSVSVLSKAGAAVSPSTGYQGGAISAPSGIIVDASGSVWVTNRSNNSVTKIIGAAAAAVTPTVTGTVNNTLGTRP